MKKMTSEKKHKITTIGLWLILILCTAVLFSLCLSEGIDYDEAYSYRTAHDNTMMGIIRVVLAAHDTDVPVWYMGLRLWSFLVGDGIIAYKMFALLGTVLSMLLGPVVIRRQWGAKTAALYMIMVSLTPAMMKISVNNRMYSWTVFGVTVCGLTAYFLRERLNSKALWTILFLTTFCGIFSHYFTAFSYLFIYLYLVAVIWQQDRKQIWKPFVCGGSVVLLFVAWLIKSDFFHLLVSDGNPTNRSKFGIYEFFDFIFGTGVKYATKMGELLFVLTLVCAILFWKRLGRRNGVFAVLCTCIFPVSYLMAALLALHASHFFTYRHVMHSMGLFWLGMAIILSRINLQEWIACLSFTVWMGVSAYGISYHEEYGTISYLEETKAFIAENMEPGDVVVYDTDSRFGQLFGCYMPDQIFYTMEEVPDLEELVGKRVWYFQCFGHLLEESDKYTVTYENMGHYGLHASHFFTYRHVMHSMGLFWLGMAIILSRINLQEWIACLSFTVWMGVSAYGISYHEEYGTISYLEETKAFIAENMEPGDVVVYDTDSRFGQLFGCYMPDQIFYTMEEVPDLEELVGKRVWYFQCFGHLLEESDKYTVTYENMGHYGFQYMDGNTDFDILKVNITEETGND